MIKRLDLQHSTWQKFGYRFSGVAKLGHTGARVLPIGGCALPLEVCPNQIPVQRGAEFVLTAGRHQRIRATR